MKKTILLFSVCMGFFALNAQSVFVENFATATVGSNVEGYNNWYVSVKAADALGSSPKIAEGALFYTGYAGTNVGNVAVLDPLIGVTSTSQRISTRTITFDGGTTLKPIVGQTVYAAFLVNFNTDSYTSQRDFFTFEGSTTSSSTRGRLFAKINATGDLTLAISKNSSTSGVYIESAPIASGVGINHLLVFCYNGVEGTENDFNTLYIDPDLTKTEAQQTNKLVSTDVATDYDVALVDLKINLRQRGTSAKIGGIRVGTSWNSVVLGAGTGFNNVSSKDNKIFVVGNSILTEGQGYLKVYNLSGSEVLSSQTNGKFETALNKGIYLVRFNANNGMTYSDKIQIK